MDPTGVSAAQYLDPGVDRDLPIVEVPVLDARDPQVSGSVIITTDPADFDVPVTPWPVTGRRPLDPGTGDGGGTVEGTFSCTWEGDRLLATNDAVGGRYVIGFAPTGHDGRSGTPERVILWHLNHHPDGGQLFWSPDGRAFVVPAAPAGEDPDPARVVALHSDGTFGICLRPGVWHDGVYPIAGDGRFLTRQGRVHARVSADLGAEAGVLLGVPLAAPPPSGRTGTSPGTYPSVG